MATELIAFAPVIAADAKILILGSLPGQRSLAAAQYYAHPQNIFWKIMNELLGITGDYEQRCRQLTRSGIALWDVLASSVRPGSMDADIQIDTAIANDFDAFLASNTGIRKICFNGRKAADLYQRLVAPSLVSNAIVYEDLPSTSPAYAAMSVAGKIERWRKAMEN